MYGVPTGRGTDLGQKTRGTVGHWDRQDAIARTPGQPNNWLLIKRDDKFADIDWQLKTILNSD